ncbi:MAG: radical SAM protein [Candidatus Azambacteria bacterium]|nr:radical SAM protein [Candidatus Azambacteria bacterium]
MKINRKIPLIKSQFVQVIKNNSKTIIWHSLFGNPKIVSKDTIALLNIFSNSRSLSSVLGEYNIGENGIEVIQDLIASHYLIPKNFDERKFLAKRMQEREESITSGSLIDYLELIMSEACNFRCIYCIHFNNLGITDRIKNPKKFMTFKIAKEAVDQYLKILQRHGKNVASINFGGGEPLLVWSVIEQVIKYCISHYSHDFVFRFSINTNASLITADIARKLKEYRVEIASSLDGLRDGNNQVRLTKSGGGTFRAIMRGFDNLAEQGHPLKGIAITVNEKNFPFLDEKIINWASNRQMQEVRIDIDVIGMVEIPVDDIVEKLMRIRQYAKSREIEVAGFWSRPAENLNDLTLNTHIAFCGAVRGNSICVNPSGDIYGCGYSTKQLGTLHQIESFYVPGSRYHLFVKDHLTGAIEMCKGCIIEGQCGGGCNITQEFARATKTVKIKRMCAFYRKMTRKLLLEQI